MAIYVDFENLKRNYGVNSLYPIFPWLWNLRKQYFEAQVNENLKSSKMFFYIGSPHRVCYVSKTQVLHGTEPLVNEPGLHFDRLLLINS